MQAEESGENHKPRHGYGKQQSETNASPIFVIGHLSGIVDVITLKKY